MDYYITAEGGGTKLITVLYDADYHVIRSMRTSGTNDFYRRSEDIRQEMRNLITHLITENDRITEIAGLDTGMVGSRDTFFDILNEKFPIKRCCHYGEGQVALAANMCRYGLVAQCGTGSDAFLIQPHIQKTVGGWGALLGDEGSGYDIGLTGIKSAIYAFDHRGKQTVLLDMIEDKFQTKNLWDLVGRLSKDPDMRRTVASCALLVSKAAYQNDAVALEIYRKAADSMVNQVIAALSYTGDCFEGPIVMSGGAWRGHPSMAQHFIEEIKKNYPQIHIEFPLFEPVVGPVFLRMISEGTEAQTATTILKASFYDFLDPNRSNEHITHY